MATTISKTVITITVLHRTDEPLSSIYEALERIDTGNGVGDVEIGTAQYVEDVNVPEALVELGNDGTFFDDDLGVGTEEYEIVIQCERHGGPWGDDETCARCTFEDGTPRPFNDKGPLGPGAEN